MPCASSKNLQRPSICQHHAPQRAVLGHRDGLHLQLSVFRLDVRREPGNEQYTCWLQHVCVCQQHVCLVSTVVFTWPSTAVYGRLRTAEDSSCLLHMSPQLYLYLYGVPDWSVNSVSDARFAVAKKTGGLQREAIARKVGFTTNNLRTKSASQAEQSIDHSARPTASGSS